jgi:hypothetical protein
VRRSRRPIASMSVTAMAQSIIFTGGIETAGTTCGERRCRLAVALHC